MEQASSDDLAVTGKEIVARARAWIGTPYEHQASCRGAGTDCLGLLRGIWRECFGQEPEHVPAYSPDWSEANDPNELVCAMARHLAVLEVHSAGPGDVLVMKMIDRGSAKHLGFLAHSSSGFSTFIHAYSRHGVVESPLTPTWARRIVAAFRFPYRRL